MPFLGNGCFVCVSNNCKGIKFNSNSRQFSLGSGAVLCFVVMVVCERYQRSIDNSRRRKKINEKKYVYKKYLKRRDFFGID